MSVVFSITGRNLKLFFRDRLNVFFSLLGALIVFLLYALFLSNLQTSSITGAFPQADAADVRGFVDSWMFGGIVAMALPMAREFARIGVLGQQEFFLGLERHDLVFFAERLEPLLGVGQFLRHARGLLVEEGGTARLVEHFDMLLLVCGQQRFQNIPRQFGLAQLNAYLEDVFFVVGLDFDGLLEGLDGPLNRVGPALQTKQVFEFPYPAQGQLHRAEPALHGLVQLEFVNHLGQNVICVDEINLRIDVLARELHHEHSRIAVNHGRVRLRGGAAAYQPHFGHGFVCRRPDIVSKQHYAEHGRDKDQDEHLTLEQNRQDVSKENLPLVHLTLPSSFSARGILARARNSYGETTMAPVCNGVKTAVAPILRDFVFTCCSFI